MSYYAWRPYVPVAERRRWAEKKLAKLKQNGQCRFPCHDRGPGDRQVLLGQVLVRQSRAVQRL